MYLIDHQNEWAFISNGDNQRFFGHKVKIKGTIRIKMNSVYGRVKQWIVKHCGKICRLGSIDFDVFCRHHPLVVRQTDGMIIQGGELQWLLEYFLFAMAGKNG